MGATLAELCDEMGVEIIDTRQSRSRRPGQTCADRTLARILEDEGEAHLRSVLITLMETENNKRMLIAPVLWAISDVLRGFPAWFGDTWLTAFDKIDLAELHARAKEAREAVPPRAAIASMLIETLRPKFSDEPQGRLI